MARCGKCPARGRTSISLSGILSQSPSARRSGKTGSSSPPHYQGGAPDFSRERDGRSLVLRQLSLIEHEVLQQDGPGVSLFLPLVLRFQTFLVRREDLPGYAIHVLLRRLLVQLGWANGRQGPHEVWLHAGKMESDLGPQAAPDDVRG